MSPVIPHDSVSTLRQISFRLLTPTVDVSSDTSPFPSKHLFHLVTGPFHVIIYSKKIRSEPYFQVKSILLHPTPSERQLHSGTKTQILIGGQTQHNRHRKYFLVKKISYKSTLTTTKKSATDSSKLCRPWSLMHKTFATHSKGWQGMVYSARYLISPWSQWRSVSSPGPSSARLARPTSTRSSPYSCNWGAQSNKIGAFFTGAALEKPQNKKTLLTRMKKREYGWLGRTNHLPPRTAGCKQKKQQQFTRTSIRPAREQTPQWHETPQQQHLVHTFRRRRAW